MKARLEAKKANKALQAVVREDNINKVRIEKQAQKQAQKKETTETWSFKIAPCLKQNACETENSIK